MAGRVNRSLASASAYVNDMNGLDDALTRSRQDTHALLDDPMMKMKWYHPFLTRHAAECMLIDNSPEGSYLLRPSTSGNVSEYALSVKFSQSVQHMKVVRLPDGKYRFGQSNFDGEDALRRHFEQEKPIVGGDNNVTVVLKYPYSREIDENHLYIEVHHHAVTNMLDLSKDSDLSSDCSGDSNLTWDQCDTLHRLPYITPVSSREGYLTKRGNIRKNWKVRWFVLRNTTLSYYKTKQSRKPIRSINMLEAMSVDYDTSTNKDFCFRIVLPKRTFLMYANSNEDCEQWIELLQSKIFVKRSSRISSDLSGPEFNSQKSSSLNSKETSLKPITSENTPPNPNNNNFSTL